MEQDSKPTQPISWAFHFSTAKTHGPIFTQNSPNDMLPAKEVPFGVTKNNFYLIPFLQNCHFKASYDGLEKVSIKNDFTT